MIYCFWGWLLFMVLISGIWIGIKWEQHRNKKQPPFRVMIEKELDGILGQDLSKNMEESIMQYKPGYLPHDAPERDDMPKERL